jgi:ABC-type sulfate transport system permease subunit
VTHSKEEARSMDEFGAVTVLQMAIKARKDIHL